MSSAATPTSRKACVHDSAGLEPLRMASVWPLWTLRAHSRLLGRCSRGACTEGICFLAALEARSLRPRCRQGWFLARPFLPCHVLAWPCLCAWRRGAGSGVSSSSHKDVGLSDWRLTLMTSSKAPSPDKVTWKVRASTWDRLWRGGGRRARFRPDSAQSNGSVAGLTLCTSARNEAEEFLLARKQTHRRGAKANSRLSARKKGQNEDLPLH